MHNTGHHTLTNEMPRILISANQSWPPELSQRQQKQSKSEGQPGQTRHRRTDTSANNSPGQSLHHGVVVVHWNRHTYRRTLRQIQIEEFALSKMYNYSHNAMSLLSQAAGWKPPNWLSMLWNSEYLVKMLLLRVWGIFRWLLKCAADNGGAADCQDQSFLSVSSGGEKNERFY